MLLEITRDHVMHNLRGKTPDGLVLYLHHVSIVCQLSLVAMETEGVTDAKSILEKESFSHWNHATYMESLYFKSGRIFKLKTMFT